MCHCLACQRRTGSTYGVQARYAVEQIHVAGDSTTFQRVGDSGGSVTFHFCASCGATVYWELGGAPGFVAVAVGAFGDPTFPSPRVSVYEARRHEWVAMPTGSDITHYD